MIKTGIGVISPANGLLNMFPNRVKQGVEFLEQNNFTVKFAKNSFKNEGYYSSKIEDRINDINELVKDPDIDVILASIGGYNSNQLLPYIDYELIKTSNKLICGYSDITCLILAIYSKTGITTIHGPTFLPEICEYPSPFSYTYEYFLKAIYKQDINYIPPEYEINEYIDWKDQENNIKKRAREKSTNMYKWEILNKGEAKGKIIGGNLSSMLTILGSEYLPYELFKNKILFLEDTETSLAEFDSYMTGLKLQGIFDNIIGLIIGKFESKDINKNIRHFLETFFNKYDIPIIYNVDLGHTNPKISIPIGETCYLKCNNEIEFKII